MESTQELQHWGIKGQRWGVRRYQNPDGTLTEAGKKRYYYQNPDGSLTEAGKKDYMKAARKGKLDVSKLSDNDLNMINSRFAREKTFKQNVSDYEKSTFKYRLKEAVLARIKGSGGGGGGGGGKKKGGSGIGNLLAMPIKKAFEEAFKDSSSGGGKDDGDEFDFEAVKQYREYTKNGHVWEKGFAWSKADKRNRKRWEKEGKRFVDDSTKNWNAESEDYGKNRSSGSRSSEDILRSRHKPMPQKQQQKGQRTKELEREKRLEERLSKSGLVLGHSEIRFVVRRSDELYHHGIKGQHWGIRRYQNPDGTLTPEGKERYYSDKEKRKLADTVEKTVVRKHSIYATDGEIKKASKYGSEVEEHPVVKDAARKVQTELKTYKDAERDMYEQMDAFYNDKKTYEKYLNKAVNYFMKEVGPDWGSRQQAYDWFKYDDGDQGDRSSIELYKRSPEGKKLVQAEERARETYKAYSDACKKYASEYLGSYGNKNVSAYGDWQRNIASRLSDFVMRVAENDK